MEVTPGPPPRPRPGPRCGRRGRGARRPHPRRDRARRADHLRPVHGPRPVRPRRRLLPGRRGAARARGRLPDRPGGAPDLRCRAGPGRRRRLGPARPARRRSSCANTARGRARSALAILDGLRARATRTSPRRIRYQPVEVEAAPARRASPRRFEAAGLAAVARPRRRAGRADRRRRPRQRGPRRAAGPPRRRARRRPARGPRRLARRRASSTSRPIRPRPRSRERLDDEGVALADGQRAEICLALDALGGGRRRRPRARRRAAHRLRLPGGRAVRPGPAARRDAPRLPPPSRPRRPVHPRRPPGPDRPRRRHRRRAGGGRGRPRPTSARRPRPSSSSASARRTCSRRIQADPATTLEGYLAVRSALIRLLDPSAMGRFRVMAFGRGWPADGPPLRGLGYRLRAESAASRPHLTAPDPTGIGRCTYCRSPARRRTIHHGRARPDGEWRANLHARSARAAPRHHRRRGLAPTSPTHLDARPRARATPVAHPSPAAFPR